ncbi:MAG TPA: hypothetical protein VLB46_01900 [Pyrinomonadaceae bacterium]|nr:hypothetical protein [Pyrinomonadaceae bacterium]
MVPIFGKPRIELDDKKHKETTLAPEEVRRDLISFTQSALPHVHEGNGMGALKAGVEESLPLVRKCKEFSISQFILQVQQTWLARNKPASSRSKVGTIKEEHAVQQQAAQF